MSKLPISCYVLAFNEADRIGITLESVRHWVDELLVIDSGSTDDTVKVAESHGARVISNPWPGYGFQKRFAEDQCRNDWLFNIDSDEEVTTALKQEIQGLFTCGAPDKAGYIIRIRDLLPGEKKLAPLAHTDFRLRLYDKRKGRAEASNIYDGVIMQEGETAILNAPMLHRSFRSLSHMMEKINGFTTVQANDLLKKGMAFPRLRLFLETPFAFFKCYVLRAYALRGWRGFIFSVVYAYGRFLRIAKYLELRDK